MNKKLIILVISFILLSFLLIVWSWNVDIVTPEGDSFCRNKGYDSVSFSGSYSELYGKVNCVSCYNLNCSYEEYNVTKNWLGIIDEVKG